MKNKQKEWHPATKPLKTKKQKKDFAPRASTPKQAFAPRVSTPNSAFAPKVSTQT